MMYTKWINKKKCIVRTVLIVERVEHNEQTDPYLINGPLAIGFSESVGYLKKIILEVVQNIYIKSETKNHFYERT